MFRSSTTSILLACVAACGRIHFDPLDATADAGLVDAPPDAAPLACVPTNVACATPDIAVCGSRCFATCNFDLMTVQAAAQLCSDWGGGATLAIVASAAIQTCLLPFVNDAWIGLAQTVSTGDPALGWEWADGQMYPLPWNSGDPNDGDGVEDGVEQYAILSASGFGDVPGVDLKRVLCSRPAP